jgi:hypothetical protein
MSMRKHGFIITTALVAMFVAATADLPRAAQDQIDLDSINRIKALGLDPKTSEVMEISSYLTDVYGPRLSGSPNIKAAGDWTVAKMKEWGLVNTMLEPWPADPTGQNNGFPCGWANDKFYLAAVSPQAFPIHGTPTAWTPGTQGLVRGQVVYVSETTEADLRAKYPKGALKGKWVITAAPRDQVPAYFNAPGSRYTTEQLDRMENPPPPDPNAAGRGRQGQAGRQGRAGEPPAGRAGAPPAAAAAPPAPTTPPPPPPVRKDACAGKPAAKPNPAGAAGAGAGGGRGGGQGAPGFNRNAFFKTEGILGLLNAGTSGQNRHGVYTIGGGSRTADPATQLTTIMLPVEMLGRLHRMIAKGIPVVVEADIRNSYTANPLMFNVVGEIRGTDKADEIVMLGAHFDSWHASTGATDNAAGSAAMLEAMRLLKVSGVKLRRTVRIGLWNGEEQGLVGSRLYVQQKFGGRGGAPPTADHPKFAGYFNIDNGTGAIRGVHLQGNAAVGPIFRVWMKPLNDIGMTHLAPGNTGGTDHQSFDAAGLPGWQFIQDPVEYNSFTHHTNLDSYERLQADDMRKNATIAAIFAMLTANRDDVLPRKPAPAGGGRGGF